MPEPTRNNTLIDAQQGNPILLQTNINTQQLTYDASTTSFLTSTIVPVSAIMPTEDTIIFTEQYSKALDKTTDVVANFFEINRTSGKITVSVTSLVNANIPYDPAAFIVPNIPARDALLNLKAGMEVFVVDTGQGENALYMWDGTSFITISTQDSAATDAQTLTITLNYNSPTSNILGRVSPGSEIVSVIVTVITAFNGTNPTLTIGDDISGHTVVMDTSLNDLYTIDKYSSIDSYLYTGISESTIKAYYSAGGSTQGQAIISVTYI